MPHKHRTRQRKPIRHDAKTPKRRYITQRQNARQRAIPFCLTFEEWWNLWEPHWEKRGACSTCYVMARFGDKGPYAKGNVKIVTAAENLSERLRPAKLTAPAVRNIRKRLAEKEHVADIARDHGVTWAAIWRIRKGLIWRHVQ